ncbi:nuclear transport factor 2 family protein [Flavobacteriaceae bacterium M23B6Z8]
MYIKYRLISSPSSRHVGFGILTLLFFISCQKVAPPPLAEPAVMATNYKLEKAAIIETLHNETKAAFNRDYETWKTYWIQEPFVTKTYMEFPDHIEETLGWEAVDAFVRDFFKKYPDPEPVPKAITDMDIRLYENAAWVSYELNDSIRGRKRETRLMEKVGKQWKIAGMHTTIYGKEE